MAVWIQSGENTEAAGQVSYGIEGEPPAFVLDSAGNLTTAGTITGLGTGMTRLDHVLLAAPAASATLTSTGSWSWIQVRYRLRLSTAAVTDLCMQLDGDTSASYDWNKVSANNGVFQLGAVNTASPHVGISAGHAANYFGTGVLDFAGWDSATGYTSWTGTTAAFDATNNTFTEAYGGWYHGAVGPHSSVKLFNLSGALFDVGSEFALYGLS